MPGAVASSPRAAIWLLIEAEFLAIVLVLVYVGAVMVLFLFVVMMLDINIEELRSGFTRHAWLGVVTSPACWCSRSSAWSWPRGLGSSMDMKAGMAPSRPAYSNTAELGTVLYTEYVYPFELAAVLLLVAIIAAIVLTMRQPQGPEGAGHRRPGGGAARGPRAHREDAGRSTGAE